MIQEDWIGLFQSPHLSQIPSQGWIQGCNWMWQVSLRISWLTQGLPTLSWPPVPNIFLPNQYHFGWYQKNNYKKIHPCSSLLVGWKIFFLQFLVVAKCPTSFLGRDLSLPSKSCSYWCPDRGFFKTLSWGQTNYFYQPPSETMSEWERPFMGVWSKHPQISRVMMENPDLTISPCEVLNPATFLPAPEGSLPFHSFLETLDHWTKLQEGMSEGSLTNPEEIWYTDGSNLGWKRKSQICSSLQLWDHSI